MIDDDDNDGMVPEDGEQRHVGMCKYIHVEVDTQRIAL